MRNDTIALIPARKGSTRVKDKNIRLLGGKPLISRTIENALSVLPSSSIYLSTNDERIFPIANEYNVNLVRRPERVSKVDSSMEEVIYSFLDSIDFKGNILVLQPTTRFAKLQTSLQME